MEGKLPCAVQVVTSSYANFAEVWCMRDLMVLEIKKERNFKCRTYVNHQTNKAENCPGIDLNGQSLEIWRSFVILTTQQVPEGVNLTVLQKGLGKTDVISEIQCFGQPVEVFTQDQKALCQMRIGQLKRGNCLDKRGMMQG